MEGRSEEMVPEPPFSLLQGSEPIKWGHGQVLKGVQSRILHRSANPGLTDNLKRPNLAPNICLLLYFQIRLYSF